MIDRPDSNQATDGSLAGKVGDTLSKWLRDNVDDMLPAQVVSYDDATNRAVLRPLVMVGTTSGARVPRAQIAGVPVFRFGGGGFFIRHPIKAGDFGWLKANDRDISLVLQAGGGMDWPNTKRLHSFSDAMFFPDTVKNWIIAGGNADASVWQSLDGQTVIALHDDKIELKMGASTVTISAASVDIVSPTLTHNGINIGATHTHGGVQVGAGTSGGPTP